MFDIGFWELVLLGVVGLVVLGPERLPVVARTLGRWLARARRYANTLTSELENEFGAEDIRRDVRRAREEIETQAREFRSGVDSFREEAEDFRDQAESGLDSFRSEAEQEVEKLRADAEGTTGRWQESAAADEAEKLPDEARPVGTATAAANEDPAAIMAEPLAEAAEHEQHENHR